MKKKYLYVLSLYFIATFSCYAEKTIPGPSGDLIDFNTEPSKALFKERKVKATIIKQDTAFAISVDLEADIPRPGITIYSPNKQGWDLTGYNWITVEIFNSGLTPMQISVQLYSPASISDDRKYNTNTPDPIPPGSTKEILIPFERLKKTSKGSDVDPSNIQSLFIFADKPTEPGSFIIKSIKGIL